MRRLMIVAALAAGMMAAGLGGCTQGVREVPLMASESSPVADVPIPVGFYMTSQSRSTVTQGAGIRLVEHYYKGGEGLLPVVRFYREQLPLKGWTLESQQQMGSRVTINGTKANEDLAITVWEGTLDTHIEARIVPSNRAPMPK